MSDVEIFYTKICQQMGKTPCWNGLHPMQQQAFVNAINTILTICYLDIPSQE